MYKIGLRLSGDLYNGHKLSKQDDGKMNFQKNDIAFFNVLAYNRVKFDLFFLRG